MLEKFDLTPEKPKPVKDPLEGLDDNALMVLRERIEQKLKVEIKDINLTEELGIQYRQAKALLAMAVEDKDTPVNHRAQLFNSINSILNNIINQQDIVYSAERLKRFETAIYKVLSKLPLESRQIYYDLYGEFLNDKGA